MVSSHLVEVVLAREERLVADHLAQDAAHRPDVQRLGVTLHKHSSGHEPDNTYHK